MRVYPEHSIWISSTAKNPGELTKVRLLIIYFRKILTLDPLKYAIEMKWTRFQRYAGIWLQLFEIYRYLHNANFRTKVENSELVWSYHTHNRDGKAVEKLVYYCISKPSIGRRFTSYVRCSRIESLQVGCQVTYQGTTMATDLLSQAKTHICKRCGKQHQQCNTFEYCDYYVQNIEMEDEITWFNSHIRALSH